MKRHLLVEGKGVPLAITITGANVPDMRQTGAVLEAIIVVRPDGGPGPCPCAPTLMSGQGL